MIDVQLAPKQWKAWFIGGVEGRGKNNDLASDDIQEDRFSQTGAMEDFEETERREEKCPSKKKQVSRIDHRDRKQSRVKKKKGNRKRKKPRPSRSGHRSASSLIRQRIRFDNRDKPFSPLSAIALGMVDPGRMGNSSWITYSLLRIY